jgi:transposase
MRDWLPENHLVWFLLEVVDRLDTGRLHAARRRGAQGRAGYDPDMLLALLIYAYCSRVRSSRQIERLCETDVAFRVICAGRGPDHTTIARFRQEQADLARRLFVEVLAICAEAGLARVGVVALDGTKIAASASRRANRSRRQLEAEIAAMFAQAAAADAEEDDRFGSGRGDELPAELADGQQRRARLQAALDKLNQRRRSCRSVRDPVEVWRARIAENEEKLAQRRQRWAQRPGGPQRGQGQKHPEGRDVAYLQARLAKNRARLAAAEQAAVPGHKINLTDSDSRVLPVPGGFVQGYNAQMAVNEYGIVIAAEVFNDPNDMVLYTPMMASLADSARITGPVGVVLADAGYCSAANLSAPGPTRLIATTGARAARRDSTVTSGPPPPQASPLQAMAHVLRTAEGRRLYKQRSWTVEPGFGNIKANLAFTRFSRRGFPAVRGEWQLITAAANLLKLHRYHPSAVRFS